MNRDEDVAKLTSPIDQWNAEAAKWEAKAIGAQAGMRASTDAWKDMMQGADAAFKSMQMAFEKARSEFQKK